MFGLYSSEVITNLTYHDISERNIKFKIYIRQLWNGISTKYIY